MLAVLLLTCPLSSSLPPGPRPDTTGDVPGIRDQARVVVSSGTFDMFGDAEGTAFGFEYRWPYRSDPWWGLEELAPIAGVIADTEGSVYGYAGLRYDWEVGDPWLVTPSMSAGLYEEGDGLDLGHAVEFRTTIEVSRRIGTSTRLGLTVFHISNASLSGYNPGTNGVTLNLSWAPGSD